MTNETNRNLKSDTAETIPANTTEPKGTPLTEEQLQQVTGGALNAYMKVD